mmetsp:Transcript_26075/g.60145  ORF Transcript_26075/g.60145 Transcript_26075/m.60145 type:complete len:202 (-) Transcript_26075:950-1555(-)
MDTQPPMPTTLGDTRSSTTKSQAGSVHLTDSTRVLAATLWATEWPPLNKASHFWRASTSRRALVTVAGSPSTRTSPMMLTWSEGTPSIPSILKQIFTPPTSSTASHFKLIMFRSWVCLACASFSIFMSLGDTSRPVSCSPRRLWRAPADTPLAVASSLFSSSEMSSLARADPPAGLSLILILRRVIAEASISMSLGSPSLS